MLGHVTEEDKAIAHGQRIRILEIEFVLAVAVLVVEGIEIPAKSVHAGGNFVEPGEIVHEAAHVVTGFDQTVVRIGDGQCAVVIALEDIDLAFDPKIEAEAHLGGLSQHALEGYACV